MNDLAPVACPWCGGPFPHGTLEAPRAWVIKWFGDPPPPLLEKWLGGAGDDLATSWTTVKLQGHRCSKCRKIALDY
jgi:hypothetical protein